jgi:hypothetical protein
MSLEAAQQEVFVALRARHPRMLTLDDLRDDVVRPELEPALAGLKSDGVVSQLGEMFSLSWVAVRITRLLER